MILFPDILCDVRPLFPATFTKFSPIKLGKPLSYVISFRMQEIGVFSDLENLNLAPTTVPPIARVPLLTYAPRASSTPNLGPSREFHS